MMTTTWGCWSILVLKMNTVALNYHLWVMSQCPEVITEYIQCKDGTGYEVVQLLAALDLDIKSKNFTHGQMIAGIRYHKPFL